ncbi:MAG: HD domain-containing protein [Bacteroidales bacterium]|nr:HD domain-containing protein [Bacteroidales bacterium]
MQIVANFPQFLSSDIFRIISEVAFEEHLRCFVIGGYVRDCFLGRESNDIDVVVEGSGIALAQALGKRLGKSVSVFKNFGTSMLRYKGIELEFVGARKESYSHDSRKPFVENGTLEDDQLRRDFTINAMAFSLCKENFGELVDPFGGIKDLSKGIIRTPADPDITYSDDPLRMIRAIRFSCKLTTIDQRFEICKESKASIWRNRERLSILSRERIVEEMNKILLCERPSIGLWQLYELGLLQQFLPAVSALYGTEMVDGYGHKENFTHTLTVVDNVCALEKEAGREPNLYLRWAALLHDIGKPASKRLDANIGWTFYGHDIIGGRMVPGIFKNLKMPLNEKMKYVQKLVRLHLRPIALVTDEVTDSAVRRLLFDAGDDVEDLMLLCKADVTSKNPFKVEALRSNFDLVCGKMAEIEAKDAIRNFKNPITGEYLMETYNLPPCSTLGQIKEYVKEAILDGKIANTFEAAAPYAQEYAATLGLKPVK